MISFYLVRDRFVVRLIMAFTAFCIVNTNAFCFHVDSLVGYNHVSLNENLIVTDTGTLNANRIDVDGSILISNHGVINSDFYVADALRVYVKNSGIINGEFRLGENTNLIQVIESVDDITGINVDSNFDILVHDAENVSLTDVISIADCADKIILDNSTLFLNDANRNRINISSPTIEIVGDVVLKLNSSNGMNYSVPVLRNVSGSGSVRFDAPDMNPLYKAVASINNGDLYMSIARETDYARILKNDVGNFLNNLRHDFPNDKLLTALDNASNMGDLNSIMSGAVRLHPIKLMEPVRRMNLFDMLSTWRYGNASGVYSNADVMFSDSDFGGRVKIAVVDDVTNILYAAITGYAGKIDVSDDINDFLAYVYGANIATHYDDGTVIGNLSVGGNYTSFDVGPVLDGKDVVHNPDGISGYMSMDVGTYVLRNNSVTIASYVGGLTNYMSVLGDSDISALANLSAEINWSEHTFDILYDYGLRGSVLTDGAFYANTYVKFMAPFDNIGAELNFGFLHDGNGINYKISISAHMLF